MVCVGEYQSQYTIYAIKAKQPWEDGAAYWIPLLYRELQEGRARFGWGYGPTSDIRVIEKKIQGAGFDDLTPDERGVWSRAGFLLDVRPGDYFIYINMPEWGQCTVVQIDGEYDYDDEPWDPDREDDFRHRLPCHFVAQFDRNDDVVHPILSQRLKLQGARYRIGLHREFEELLRRLASGEKGTNPNDEIRNIVGGSLRAISEEIYRHFPRKNLEDFVAHLLKSQPNIKEVRKGPDRNGADLEVDIEVPIGPVSLKFCCAVQVKAYTGAMDYTRAIRDIEKALASDPRYDCGLIVTTASEYTQQFEQALNELRDRCKKPVEVLLGSDLAYTLVSDYMNSMK